MIRTIIYILFTIVLIFTENVTFSQDIHFSQFYASPLTLDPSLTGNFNGKWRLSNIYRRQWDAFGIPYQTISIGFDHKFSLMNGDDVNAGIVFVNDNSGGANLNVNKFGLSGSYIKKFENHSVALGAQGAYVLKGFKTNDITFPDQYDLQSGMFSTDMITTGPAAGDNLSYLDINAGIAWRGVFNGIEPVAGISFFHLNMPKESFLDDNNKLPLRSVIHAGGRAYVGTKMFLDPNILYMTHSKANDLLSGVNVGYIFSNEYGMMKAGYAGPFFRNGFNRNPDALIFVIGMIYNKINVGISYDFNISYLKTVTNYKGALEISLIYKELNYQVDKIALPCDVH